MQNKSHEPQATQATQAQGLVVQTDLSAGASIGDRLQGMLDKATSPDTWSGITANWDTSTWQLS